MGDEVEQSKGHGAQVKKVNRYSENLQKISTGFDPWVRKIPWRRKWQPTPVFLSGKSHGQGAWWATVHGVSRVRHNLVTKLPNDLNSRYSDIFPKRRCASLLVFQYLEVYFYLSHHHLHFYELESYLLLPFFVSIVLTFESKTHTHTHTPAC